MGTAESKAKNAEQASSVASELHEAYLQKLYPIEKRHLFHDIHASELGVEDFSSKPMVLLLGQYSTGKTTFIQQMLGRDYPGIRISPEPTTDKFICLVHGESGSIDEGHVVVSDESLPFKHLESFGDSFLCNLECIRIPRQAGHKRILEDLLLIDTPGVLAGEKQSDRGYNYQDVVSWFADHVDTVIIFFDVSKLDISDEMKGVIRAVRNKNAHKVHIVLNKADQVETSSLIRIYGALMWALRGVLETPEVPRVYIGSFWDKPLKHEDQRALFDDDSRDLNEMLRQLSRNSNVRKMNMLIRRAKMARAHAYVMDYLQSNAPRVFGKDAARERLLADLPGVFRKLSVDFKLPLGDFPDATAVSSGLQNVDLTTLQKIDKKEIDDLDNFIKLDLPFFLKQLPEQMQADLERERWLVKPNEMEYKRDFNRLEPKNGKVPVKKALASARIPLDVMQQILELVGHEENGELTLSDFSLTMNLVGLVHEGHSLPESLPDAMRNAAEADVGEAPRAKPMDFFKRQFTPNRV